MGLKAMLHDLVASAVVMYAVASGLAIREETRSDAVGLSLVATVVLAVGIAYRVHRARHRGDAADQGQGAPSVRTRLPRVAVGIGVPVGLLGLGALVRTGGVEGLTPTSVGLGLVVAGSLGWLLDRGITAKGTGEASRRDG